MQSLWQHSPAQRAAGPIWLLATAVLMLPAAGCHRALYRVKADDEVYSLIAQKANDPHWALQRLTVDIDPRSRMFDPFNPDHPPMPPDDATSHTFMHCVDHKRGYPNWDDNGFTPTTENPLWQQFLPVNEEGVLVMDADQAVRLAWTHSSDYQSQLETLYFSALDVSAERFFFDTQFFGSYGTDYRASGELRDNERSRLFVGTPRGGNALARRSGNAFPGFQRLGDRLSSRFELNKFFISGGELIAGLANSFVWDLHGIDTLFVNTTLDFTLIQPLLRRAGRDRILETLTRAERQLLSNVRQLERFRRGFYVEIITGANAGQGPTRAGGVFGASGLSGFTGVGGGGFGGLTGGAGGAGGTAARLGELGAGNVGGFLGLLQDQQDIRNQEANVAGLRDSLLQLQESLRGRLDTNLNEGLQVVQAQQALFNGQSRLLTSQVQYQTTLDNFKRLLGLPPDLPVQITDDMVDQFNLIDTDIVSVQSRLSNLRLDVGRANDEILQQVEFVRQGTEVIEQITWSENLAKHLEQLKTRLPVIESTRRRLVRDNLPRALEDIRRLREAVPERREELRRLRDTLETAREEAYSGDSAAGELTKLPVDASTFDVERLEQLPEELEKQLPEIEASLADHAAQLDVIQRAVARLQEEGPQLAPDELLSRVSDEVVLAISGLLSGLSEDVLALSLLQARARAESVRLVPIELDSREALEIARRYRRDWMNARAALVDQWRLIEFNADNLEAFMNVVFSGDISNVGKNPVKFQDATGQLRVGLQFDAPFTRLQERNTYRQSLVEYSRARRNYYQFQDSISAILRETLRTIEANQINFEVRRTAVLVAIRQVEINRYIRTSPPRPGEAAQLGVTAARDIISALQDLQDAQNSFLGVWISYETLRRTLDRDLGTMQLDPEGIWLDPGPIGGKHGLPGVPYDADCLLDQMPLIEQVIPLDDQWELLPPGNMQPAPLPEEELPRRQEPPAETTEIRGAFELTPAEIVAPFELQPAAAEPDLLDLPPRPPEPGF